MLEDDAANAACAIVSATDLARHVMRVSTTMEQRSWWRREVMLLEDVTAAIAGA